MVRVRGFKQLNFHISDLDKAIAKRNILCQLGISTRKGSAQGCRVRTKSAATKTSDLPVGVSINVTKKTLADGSISAYRCIRAGVTIDGKTLIKMFSVEKLGFEMAWQKGKRLNGVRLSSK